MVYFPSTWYYSQYSFKGGFFSEGGIRFSNLQHKIFQKTILNLKFKFPAKKHFTVIGGKLKFQAQDSFLEYLFLRFGDLKKFHRTF